MHSLCAFHTGRSILDMYVLSLFKRISQINCLTLFFMIKREKTLASQDQKKFKNNPIIICFSKNKYMKKSNKTEQTDGK